MLVSIQKVENAVYKQVAEDGPVPKGFYVLANPWRPNEGGANTKGESRIRKEPQLLVLGDTAEDELAFKNTVAPENTSYKYFHDPSEFVKHLMEDGDPEDGNPVEPKLSSAALADSLAEKLAQVKAKKEQIKEAGRLYMCRYKNEIKKSARLLKIVEEQRKKLEDLGQK
jgi:hypothetical protein